MKYTGLIYKLLLATGFIIALNACQSAEGNQTGSEFIPDMAHSLAYEPNVYGDYSLNTFPEKSEIDRKKLSAAFLPVKGTIPRGYAGIALGETRTINEDLGGISVPVNAHVPYYYEDTEEERVRATLEITKNPFPITEQGLQVGKDLYDIYCGICHGPSGDGQGYLVREDGGKYPAAPANFMLDEFVASSAGRYYHAIMYGKNVMTSYADKLNYEERWQVIHYIRSLQAKSKKLDYNKNVNALNNEATPGATLSGNNASEETEVSRDTTVEVSNEVGSGQGNSH